MIGDLFIERDASISACGRYRWSLMRNWDRSMRLPWLGWLLLNPSIADAQADDPTVCQLMRFAFRLGFGGITVRNIFPYRATDPDALYKVSLAELLGPEPHKADQMIFDMWSVCPVVVAGWGKHGALHDRGADLCVKLANRGLKLHCVATNACGHPRHPLYTSAETPLREFTWRDHR